MPGNPTECREQARRCLQLAAEAPSPFAKQHFEALAQSWMHLASDIECTNQIGARWSKTDEGRRRDETRT